MDYAYYRSQPDETLILHLAEGDLSALNEIMNRYQRKIAKFVYNYLNDYDEACDATQDVFFNAFKHRKSFRKNARLNTWLYAIARNRCLNVLRSRRRHPAMPIEHVPENDAALSDNTSIDDVVANREMLSELKKALGKLPTKYRDIVILREFEGLSYKEISRIINVKESTLRVRMGYALDCIQKMLKK
ncbi:RNA polymerase sigma factor [Spirochaetota bacterium]